MVNERRLDGQVAIVTGAARAIGREIAEVLAARGAKVISFDLSPSDDTVAAVRSAGGEAAAMQVDVTDESAVTAAVNRVAAEHGGVHVLVNNAGLFAGIERRPFWEIDLDEWGRVLSINVDSVFVCSKAVSSHMREARQGRIINISSNTVSFGMPNLLHYVASKAAVVGITRSLARELGPYDIAVNAVSPGLVTTEVTRETIPAEYRDQVAKGQPLQHPLEPRDIAEAVGFLAGPGAEMITGQTLLVNGGATMGPA